MVSCKRLVTVGLLWSVTACESLGPDRGDPAQYLLADPVSFQCGQWLPTVPAEALGLFDIYFGLEGTPPSATAVKHLIKAGGTIIRRFQVNGVRAVFPISAAPKAGAREIRSVSAVARIEHWMAVGFHGKGQGNTIVDAGGQINWQSTDQQTYFATIPDAGIATVRQEPALRYLEVNVPGCWGN